VSLTAPIKPVPPTVPQVKLHPVESNSQNTAQTEQPVLTKTPDPVLQKPAASVKPESAVNSTTVIERIEPNNQDKVPLLNMPQNKGNTNADTVNTTAVTEQPPVVDKLNSFDLYAAIICLALFIGMALYFFWRYKALDAKAKTHKRQASVKQSRSGGKAAMPRTVIDYSADNTKEIVDMLTGPDDLQPDTTIKNKIKVKSNFEFRV
jgi:hypothetical protein